MIAIRELESAGTKTEADIAVNDFEEFKTTVKRTQILKGLRDWSCYVKLDDDNEMWLMFSSPFMNERDMHHCVKTGNSNDLTA